MKLIFILIFYFLEPKQVAITSDRVCGEIKLSLQYHRGALTLMVNNLQHTNFFYFR